MIFTMLSDQNIFNFFTITIENNETKIIIFDEFNVNLRKLMLFFFFILIIVIIIFCNYFNLYLFSNLF